MDTKSRLQLSYFKGAEQPPLLETTIGDYLDDIAARFPHREALVVRHQGIRWTYGEYLCEIEKLARGLLALGIRPGRPGRDLGAKLLRVVPDAVRHRQDRRHPGLHQPGLPGVRTGIRAQHVRLPGHHRGRAVQEQPLSRHAGQPGAGTGAHASRAGCGRSVCRNSRS